MQGARWQPTGELASREKRTLNAAIRERLPPIDSRGSPDWEHGVINESKDTVEQPGAVSLSTLSWRTLDKVDWNKRAAVRGVFSGRAWLNDKDVDFTGDSVRDLVTGAFLEFQLVTAGL